MNTEATEYSKSGTDDASARQDEAAFNPNLTSPESQHEKAGEGKGVSDSGANTKDDSVRLEIEGSRWCGSVMGLTC